MKKLVVTVNAHPGVCKTFLCLLIVHQLILPLSSQPNMEVISSTQGSTAFKVLHNDLYFNQLSVAMTGEGYSGIRGISHSVYGNGLWGEADGAHGKGVYGGQSGQYGAGVYAFATGQNAYGVYAESSGNEARAIYALSNEGHCIVGEAKNYGTGVRGTSQYGYGVEGTTDGSSGFGVYGHSDANYSRGVYGSSIGIEGIGVLGTANVTDGSGVVGSSNGTNGFGVYGSATGTNGTGVYGTGSFWAGYFVGNVHVQGTLSKNAGGFKIDHPLDPDHKYLSHSFVESPDMKNFYDGMVTTDGSGNAQIILPHWFVALNKDFRYQLTVIDQFAQAIVSEKIASNAFSIKTNIPLVEVSWQVTATRKDAFAEKHRIPVEEDKSSEDRGKYLHPDAFGQPMEKALGYQKNAAQIEENK